VAVHASEAGVAVPEDDDVAVVDCDAADVGVVGVVDCDDTDVDDVECVDTDVDEVADDDADVDDSAAEDAREKWICLWIGSWAVTLA